MGIFSLVLLVLVLTTVTKTPEWIVIGFQIFAWAPKSKKYNDFKEKKTILGGQKQKWAVSPRRVCATVLKFCMGS